MTFESEKSKKSQRNPKQITEKSKKHGEIKKNHREIQKLVFARQQKPASTTAANATTFSTFLIIMQKLILFMRKCPKEQIKYIIDYSVLKSFFILHKSISTPPHAWPVVMVDLRFENTFSLNSADDDGSWVGLVIMLYLLNKMKLSSNSWGKLDFVQLCETQIEGIA